MAYNSSEKLSLLQKLKRALDENEDIDLISVTSFKFLDATRLVSYQEFPTDGAIGLGIKAIESDDIEIVEDSNFLETLVEDAPDLNLKKQQFAIYALETGKYIPNYVIQFGGYDTKYAHEHSKDVVWIPLSRNSNYWEL